MLLLDYFNYYLSLNCFEHKAKCAHVTVLFFILLVTCFYLTENESEKPPELPKRKDVFIAYSQIKINRYSRTK